MKISRERIFAIITAAIVIFVVVVYFFGLNPLEHYTSIIDFIGVNRPSEPLIGLPFKQQPFESSKGKYKPKWAKDAHGDYQEYLYTTRKTYNENVSLPVLIEDSVMSVSSQKSNNLYSTFPGISQREIDSNSPVQFKSF